MNTIFNIKTKNAYYKALIAKDTQYEGIFFYAVDTTGTFCRPTCPSRKPKIENCQFFKTTEEASNASFRPCLRCNPSSPPNGVTTLIESLLRKIEENPDKHWHDEDFSKLGINPTTVRRQFKKRFGTTFVEYIRLHRLELAINLLKSGKSVIETQLSLGYESSSGLRDAFYRVLGAAPSKFKNINILKTSLVDTPFGPLKVVANDKFLYFLDFVDQKDLDSKIETFRLKTDSIIFPGISSPILSIKKELNQYFAGKLQTFTTPLWTQGTSLQQSMWEEVKQIPFGTTKTYSDIMQSKDYDSKAIANAAKSNHFAFIIPFHRLVKVKEKINFCQRNATRNQWLLHHEQIVRQRNKGT